VSSPSTVVPDKLQSPPSVDNSTVSIASPVIVTDVWFQTDAEGARVFDLAAVAQAAGSKVDLSNSEVDTVRVSLSDVLEVGSTDIMSGSTSVTITGDAMDTVELSTEGGDWSLSGTAVEGEDTYMIYENKNVILRVNEKINMIIL
jgi:hypothetical protein